MTKGKRQEMFEVFAEAFHDVVVPVLESMDKRIEKLEAGQQETNGRLENVENIGERSERKLDAHIKRLDGQEEALKRY